MLRLVTNSVDTENVRETTIGGDTHLVAEDVTFVRPMRLAGGYVPEDELRESTTRWSGVPLTVNHPRNDAGQPISVNTETGQELVVGHLRNPRDTSTGALSGDLAVNVERAEAMGGEAQDIVDALRNDETLEVSSQYFGEELPSGNYDGEFRTQVEGNLRPDSVALLPNKSGVCSVEDGCGFGAKATANAEPTANQEEGDIVRWQSAGGTAYGTVVETIEEGQFDEEISGDVTVGAPAALIQIHRPTGDGVWSPTQTFVAHKTNNDTLTVINSFPSDFPRANVVTDAVAASKSLSLTAVADDASAERQAEDGGTPTANILSSPRTPEFDGTETQEEQPWGEVSKDLSDVTDALGIDADTVADMTGEQRNEVATHTLLGDSEAETWRDLFFFPVVNPNTGNLNEGALNAVRGGRGESADIPAELQDAAETRAANLLVDNFEGYDEEDVMTSNSDKIEDLVAKLADKVGIKSNDESGGNPDRETLIDEVVANSELEHDNVEGIDDDCLSRLHESVVGNSAEATEGGQGDETDGPETPEGADGKETEETEETEQESNDMEDEDIDKIVEAIDSRIDEKIDEKVSANREQREKEDKVDSIVANSAEYTEDDRDTLMNTPDSVLDDIEQSVTGGGINVPSANTGDGVDVSGGDDVDTEDVGAGVFE